MSLAVLLLALAPLLLVFVLLLIVNLPADIAGLCGWLSAVAVAFFFFGTPVEVIGRATLSGAISSLPIGLAIGASVFQIAVMAEAGALGRVLAFIKTVSPGDRGIQVLLISCGVGILFTSFGAVTMAILPPILLGLGYSVFAAVALACLGYTGACIYALMGVPVVIFAHQAGIGLTEAGMLFAEFLPFTLLCVSLACLWLAGGGVMLRKSFWPAVWASILSGLLAIPLAKMGIVTLSGIFVGMAYCVILLLFLRLRGQPIMLREEAAQPAGRLGLAAATSPWLLLVGVSIFINTPALPFFDLLFRNLSMPVEIIPGRPDMLRVFWQVYFWIPVCTLLCLPLLGMDRARFRAALQKTAARAPRPVAALTIFFAIASVYVYSGYDANWTPSRPQENMIGILSLSASGLLGTAYTALAPFLGLIAGVISGSQSAGVAMLTKLHLGAGEHIGLSGALLALFSALGSGLAGAVSPAKVMSAAASIDRIGEEGGILRALLVPVLLITTATALLGLLWMLV